MQEVTDWANQPPVARKLLHWWISVRASQHFQERVSIVIKQPKSQGLAFLMHGHKGRCWVQDEAFRGHAGLRAGAQESGFLENLPG